LEVIIIALPYNRSMVCYYILRSNKTKVIRICAAIGIVAII